MTAHMKGQREARSHLMPETRTGKRPRLISEDFRPITAHFSDDAIANLLDRAETPFEQVPMGDRTVSAHRGNEGVSSLVDEQMKRGSIAPRQRPTTFNGLPID